MTAPRRAAADHTRVIPARYLPIGEQLLVNKVHAGQKIIAADGDDITQSVRDQAPRIAKDYDRLMRQLAGERGGKR